MEQQSTIITHGQKIILDEIRQNGFFQNNFYFTGGTALSEIYLQHRYSDDLDFFTHQEFDHQVVFSLIDRWAKKHGFTFTSRFVEVVYIFNIKFEDGNELKVDFGHYPYRKIDKEVIYQGVKADSLIDIGINKLLTISQRLDVKDYVDLYFLLDKFSIWDLMEGVKIKFGVKTDPLLLAADLLVADKFEFLPRMIKPLTLEELKKFFTKKAKELGKQAVE